MTRPAGTATAATTSTTTATATAPLRPTGLTVLYDANCPVCRQARRWVERQRLLLPVRFVAAGSESARRGFPALDVGSTLTDVTAITDDGAVLRGERAWIAVLWAIAHTRRLAVALAHGHGRRRLRRARGAAESVRRWSASEPALARRATPRSMSRSTSPATSRSTSPPGSPSTSRSAGWPAPRTERSAPPCTDRRR